MKRLIYVFAVVFTCVNLFGQDTLDFVSHTPSIAEQALMDEVYDNYDVVKIPCYGDVFSSSIFTDTLLVQADSGYSKLSYNYYLSLRRGLPTYVSD